MILREQTLEGMSEHSSEFVCDEGFKDNNVNEINHTLKVWFIFLKALLTT